MYILKVIIYYVVLNNTDRIRLALRGISITEVVAIVFSSIYFSWKGMRACIMHMALFQVEFLRDRWYILNLLVNISLQAMFFFA